jgi:hypothetical protein
METRFLSARGEAQAPLLAVDFHPTERPAAVGWVFVHGFGSRRDGDKARALATAAERRGYLCAAFDQQGHGDSQGELAELTVQRSVDDLLAVLATPAVAACPRKVVIGSSFGALVAAWTARLHPQLVDALLLVAPAFGFLERIVGRLEPEQRERWRAGEAIRIRNQWIDRPLDSAILDDPLAQAEHRLAEELVLPTIVVHGKRDETVPWRESLAFFERSANPHLELRLLADGDHRLQGHLQAVVAAALALSGAGPCST